MTFRTPRPRPAFTLLEVLLASAIAALLMAALYVGMDVQIRATQVGREAVDQSMVARSILARIAADVVSCVAPIGPTTAAGSSSSAATGTTGTTAGATTTADTATAFDMVTPLNMGLQGDSGVLTVYVSKVPQLAGGSPSDQAAADQQQLDSCDIRRISYWLADTGGLARQEVKRVTADDDDTQLPPNVPDEARLVFAPEVAELTFTYWDGSAWQDTWDGSTLGSDGATPVGPPMAVKITLGLRKPSADPNDSGAILRYSHVVPIATANVQSTDTTTTGTTTGGM